MEARYRSGRSTAWITKCERSDTFVVVGFEAEKGGKDGKLVYAGSVENGIDAAATRDLRQVLDPLIQARSPLAAPVKGVKPKWVQPETLVEVAFPNAGDAGRLRHPKLKGICEDL